MESPEGRMGDARKEANLSFYVSKTIAKEFLMKYQKAVDEGQQRSGSFLSMLTFFQLLFKLLH
jgi:hypothetical protein